PQPFFLGVAYAGLGLGLSALFVRETHAHVRHEAASHAGAAEARLSTGQVFRLTTLAEPALSSCSQAGLANYLNDVPPLSLLPSFVVCRGLGIASIGVLAGISPAVWGAGQRVTGALSDRIGRKWLISGGMLLQAAALGLFAVTDSFGAWAAEAALLGAGTAMVYPTLLAAIGDRAHPTSRASPVAVSR